MKGKFDGHASEVYGRFLPRLRGDGKFSGQWLSIDAALKVASKCWVEQARQEGLPARLTA